MGAPMKLFPGHGATVCMYEEDVSPLSGIGEEAWFDGHVEKGKLGTGGILAHKGKSDFMLESAVLAYHASPDALKSMAKKIADQLP